MGEFVLQTITNATQDMEKKISVQGYQSATFDISGTATSVDVNFYIIAGSGEKRAVNPTKISGDLDIVEKGTINNVYNFDVTGITSMIVALSSISGGYVNVHMTGVE